jgi:dephospho-CoA kinase
LKKTKKPILNHAIALTGGIAAGKSTVCSLLKSYGFYIIDADLIAKEELENSKKELKTLFGDKIFNNNEIERKKLADIIFANETEREKLNSLIHPKIRAKINEKAILQEKFGLPYIMDIPLYFESGEYDCKMSVVVYTPKEIQLQRLIKRDGLSKNDAIKRVKAQMDIERKKEMANWVIDNSLDLEHLQKETEKFIDYIRGKYANIKI